MAYISSYVQPDGSPLSTVVCSTAQPWLEIESLSKLSLFQAPPIHVNRRFSYKSPTVPPLKRFAVNLVL